MPTPFLSSEEYDERAHQLYNEGLYDEALDVLREGLALYPNSVELHIGVGYARLAREEFPWARRSFEQALVLEPDHEDALAGLGETLLKFGQEEAAVRCFNRIFELGYSDDLDLMLQVGRALFREASFRERPALFELALEFFEQAKEQAPESAEAIACIGYAQHRMGDDTSAIQSLRAALQIDGEHAEARIYLANILYDRAEYEGALYHFERTRPDDHWDELGIWRLIELKRSIYKLDENDGELAPWHARLAELGDDTDDLDDALLELDAEGSGARRPTTRGRRTSSRCSAPCSSGLAERDGAAAAQPHQVVGRRRDELRRVVGRDRDPHARRRRTAGSLVDRGLHARPGAPRAHADRHPTPDPRCGEFPAGERARRPAAHRAVTLADAQGARAALGAARAAVGRLDPSRHPDELAADLMDAWSAVEQALRAAVGERGTAGMQLVREARRGQLLTFDQANALAALSAARDRARDTEYRPDAGDLDAARRALAALDASLGAVAVDGAPSAPATGAAPPAPAPLPPLGAMTPTGMRHSALAPPPTPPPLPPLGGRWRALAAAIALLVVLGGAYYWFGGPRRNAVLRRAMAAYEGGNLDSAAADFGRAVVIDPDYALPHVYLARIARRTGHLDAATAELQLALAADPGNFLALREMGAYLFVAGQYELARKFYVRAVAANPDDPAGQGFLGCTLVKLGRIDEGERWITRAGPGVWTRCVSGATPPDTLR